MSSTQKSTQPKPEDCFKILLATDIHLGYKEKDEIIGKYSESTHYVFSKLLKEEIVVGITKWVFFYIWPMLKI